MAGVRERHVFINCPFDIAYRPLLYAMQFVITDLGFVARCALEEDNAGVIRVDKLVKIIGECKYAIHDLSRIEQDKRNLLPRFNMPFELGLDLGCRWYGNKKQQVKSLLVLDKKRYRFQRFISDVSGQDPRAHNASPARAVEVVRDWLTTEAKLSDIPGGTYIWKRYDNKFQAELRQICRKTHRKSGKLTWNERSGIVKSWQKQNAL